MKTKIEKILKNNLTYVVLGIFLAIYLLWAFGIERSSVYVGDESTFQGTIIDKRLTNNKVSFTIEAEEKLICNYYSDIEENRKSIWEKVSLGSKVVIAGSLKEPTKNTVPNTFNYKKYLENKGIYYTCNIEDIREVEKTKNPLYMIKNSVVDRIMTFDEKGYLSTMIIGDKSLLDDETLDKYRNNGITHLFAISGMHIGLFAVILTKIFKKFKMKEKKITVLITLFIWFYAFLAGFSASVMRAGLFFTFISIDKFLDLKISKVKLILLTGATSILFNYRIITDLGFIYSFLTTFGLIWGSSVISKHKFLGTSLVANLFSLPITIQNFYKFNLASVFFNIIFVPLVSAVIYPLCLLTFFLRIFEPVLKIAIRFLETINTLCSNVTFLTFVVPKMNIFTIAIYYLILLIFIRKDLYKVAMILIMLILLNKINPLLDSNTHVEFLDVGQGDSAIIRSAHNKEVILVDTGGKVRKSSAKYAVSDNTVTYLNSLGIDTIDYLILTHGDYDHMGEAINIVDNLKVKKVIFNCGSYNELEKELISILDKKKIPYYSCIKELKMDNNKLHFLNTKEYDNENDNSCVFYIELNNYKFLFMGDASTVTEKEILEKYSLFNIDVLKVGHHGSRTSSGKEFINTIDPKYSIISVGKNNRYGHPNKEALENLENSKIFRTDLDGSVVFRIKKDKLKIESCSP